MGVFIELGGKRRRLRFTCESMGALAGYLARERVRTGNEGNRMIVGLEGVARILLAALVPDDPGLTLQTVKEMVENYFDEHKASSESQGRIRDLVTEALAEAEPEIAELRKRVRKVY